jgi:putative oxidoreductase
MNAIVGTVGRILWSLPFLIFGIGHLSNATQMAGMVPAWVPGGVIWVYITGLAMILAAAAINFRKMDRQAALLAALLLVIYAVTIHLPNMMSADPNLKMMGFSMFFKDLGLAGGALILASYTKA